MHFHDDDMEWSNTVSSSRDVTYDQGLASDSMLTDYLQRPVRISSVSWAVAGSLDEVINPWTLFMSDPGVQDRIKHFHLLRGDICIKIIINGNAFHYGRAIAAYHPLGPIDSETGNQLVDCPDAVLTVFSQMPHIYLNPTCCSGGELHMPYFYPSNFFRIPTADWTNAGNLYIKSFAPLQHANGALDDVTVSVFAWLENVEMCVPTTNEYDFQSTKTSYPKGKKTPKPPQQTQAKPVKEKKTKDEYGTGIISKPASIIARAANSVKDAPIIGEFAKATSIAAGAVAGIAKIFGYSRVPVVEEPSRMRPTYFGQLAVTDMPEVVEKLALDSKQELCVDSRTVGLDGEDHMELSTIVQKEAYITQFNWDVVDAADTVLWNVRVSPAMAITGTATSGTEYKALTPMCHVAHLFRNWSGDIIYRFSVVCSEYHKGRLRVTVDPNYLDLTGGQHFNNVYSRIIDIAKERDFELRVTWLQGQAYLRTRTNPGNQWSETAYSSSLSSANGVLTVQVLNELTTPNSTAAHDAYVLVSTRGGENLHFFDPMESRLSDISVFPEPVAELAPEPELTFQSLEVEPEECADTPDPTLVELTQDVIGQGDVPEEISYVYAGESVLSFRQLLRRYWFHGSESYDTASATSIVRRQITWLRANFPEFRGYSGAYSLQETATGEKFNYTKMTLLNYLAPAYLGYRGGIRHKYSFDNPDHLGIGAVTRSTDSRVGNLPEADDGAGVVTGNVNDTARRAVANMPKGANGTAVTLQSGNPALETELPFYSQYRYALSRVYSNEGETLTGTDSMSHTIAVTAPRDAWASYTRAVSVGEDFTFFWYLHAPIFYSYSDPLT